MKKLRTILCFFLSFSLFCCSCNRKEESPEKLIKYLKTIDSYTCSVKIAVMNNKDTIEYIGKQFYNKDCGSLMQLENRNILYKNGIVNVKDKIANISYTMDKSQDITLRLSFFDNFLGYLCTSRRGQCLIEKDKEINYLKIPVEIPENNDNLFKGVLYVNTDSKAPAKIMIYNKEGQLRIRITYGDFKPFCDINKNIFSLDFP